MTMQLICSVLLAFLVGLIFGKIFIPWLKRKGFVQPLKDEVQKQVYLEGESSSDQEERINMELRQ